MSKLLINSNGLFRENTELFKRVRMFWISNISYKICCLELRIHRNPNFLQNFINNNIKWKNPDIKSTKKRRRKLPNASVKKTRYKNKNLIYLRIKSRIWNSTCVEIITWSWCKRRQMEKKKKKQESVQVLAWLSGWRSNSNKICAIIGIQNWKQKKKDDQNERIKIVQITEKRIS